MGCNAAGQQDNKLGMRVVHKNIQHDKEMSESSKFPKF